MIVVGILGASDGSAHGGSAGGASVLEIARRAAATGARTEVVGAAPVGTVGDRLLLQLATEGVGHATITRSVRAAAPAAGNPDADAAEALSAEPAPPIEPADLDLALRYLPDIRAIVLLAPAPTLLATATVAAGFTGATLVVVGSVDAAALDSIGAPDLIVLDPPAHDPDGAFAGLVAAFVGRLDAGESPATAWAATIGSLAIDPVRTSTD